ncbi:MAG TPA: bifunctional DNA-formamidopyrimidine glycosylase/DNA-(apurinic or apyrimidinic site) lyase [Candidatus Saccharimonadia bacterium]
MPEGPEVETIRRGLDATVTGQQLAGVTVLWEKSLPAPAEILARDVIGARVAAMKRRAKVLMMELDNGYTLLVHLKMTGQMVLVRADGERLAGGHPSESMAGTLPDKSSRVIFEFTGGDRLFFNDQRKFGWIKLVRTDDVPLDALVSRLGPEALSPEFTAEYLAGVLARHKGAPVKAVILDQSTVGGVGNIYADESLHLAKIHPARRAGTLSAEEVARLWAAMRDIMTLGIEHGGTSFAKYVNALGGKGDYLANARVFRRDGLTCPVCGSVIEKMRVAGRGTHICPVCQPTP